MPIYDLVHRRGELPQPGRRGAHARGALGRRTLAHRTACHARPRNGRRACQRFLRVKDHLHRGRKLHRRQRTHGGTRGTLDQHPLVDPPALEPPGNTRSPAQTTRSRLLSSRRPLLARLCSGDVLTVPKNPIVIDAHIPSRAGRQHRTHVRRPSNASTSDRGASTSLTYSACSICAGSPRGAAPLWAGEEACWTRSVRRSFGGAFPSRCGDQGVGAADGVSRPYPRDKMGW